MTPACFSCADTGVASRVPIGPRERRTYQPVPCTDCARGRVLGAVAREPRTPKPTPSTPLRLVTEPAAPDAQPSGPGNPAEGA